jgi:mono/diheme cytochrome c family protein
MSTSESVSRRVLAAALLVLGLSRATAQEGPGLGVEATPEQIAAWALTVLPNGEGLPPGAGTARAGQPIYARTCAGCHGTEGQGGPSDRLVGGQGSLTSANPVKTVGSYWPYATTVFDYIRRAMPFTAPQSLTADETYALTAYLLYLNDIIGIDDVIDSATLPAVRMPNAKNFYSAYPADD